MKKVEFENFVSLIQDEIERHRYRDAYEDCRYLPPCNLTSNILNDFRNTSPQQVLRDIKVIHKAEDKYINN